jgi:di/tricarboxylate transporter
MNPQQVIFLIILAVALVLFITEWIRPDIVAVLIVIALYGARILSAQEAVSGFSSEPAIVLAGILVLGGAIHYTGLADRIGKWIGNLAGTSLTRALAVIMPAVGLFSAFTHHVTTTAIMVPVILDLSRERKMPASKLLMPMSFAASLGTTITIIGAPAFLIASTVLQQAGRPGLGIFSIAPIGLSLTLAGTLFVLLVGRFLLPAHAAGEDTSQHFRLEDYLTEITVLPDSSLVDKTISQLEDDEDYHFHAVGLMRHGRRLRAPYKQEPLQPDDVIIVRTTPEEMLAIRQRSNIDLHPVKLYGRENNPGADKNGSDDDDLFVQAVVAPKSDLVGRTIADLDFRRRYGAIVVGLWRKDGWLDQKLAKVNLRANDVLVLEGGQDSLARVARDKAFLMMVPFQVQPKARHKAWLSGAIMVGTVLLAALNLLTIEIAAIAGAVAVVLTGCIPINQAYRSIDARIFVFIAGAIPLGAAMQKTGTASLVAGWMQNAVGNWPQTLVLLALFAVVAVLTQFMSDSATTALFAPIAVALAQALGRSPEPFVVTVAMASVVAFLTPIGHHGNLLVYGPGRYEFGDFVRAGAPLTVVCALIVTLLTPLIWRG